MIIKYKLKDIMDSDIQAMLDLSTKAHEGQFRLDRKTPYINHPIMVAELVIQYGGTKLMVMISLGHDLIEDTDWTAESLGHWFKHVIGYVDADKMVEGIQALSNNKEEMNEFAHKGNYLADKMSKLPMHLFLIKMCDMICNLIDLTSPKLGENFVNKSLTKSNIVLDAFVGDIVFMDTETDDLSVLECYEDMHRLYVERRHHWETVWNNQDVDS